MQTEPEINLSTIDDPKELKALAYDQIANREEATNNLRAINTRLAQVTGAGQQFQDATQGTKPSVSDDDLGIEDSEEKVDEVE